MRRRIWIAIFCFLLPVALLVAWDYIESRRLFGVVDELRQRGEPVSRNALGRWQRPTDPQEIRAARYYSAAAELSYYDWTIANRTPEGIKQQPLSRARRAFEEVATARTVGAEAAATFQALIDGFTEALALMDTAAALPFSRFVPHGFEDYPRTYSLENLDDAGTARTLFLVSRGDDDGAAHSLWSTLKLRRAQVRTVMWQTEHLIELQYLLEHSRPSAKALEHLQNTFRERERPEHTVADLRETRAVHIESLFTREYGPRNDPLTPFAHTRWTWQPLRPLRPWVARLATSALRASQEAVEAAQQPWPAKIQSLREVAARQPDRGRRRPVDILVHIIRGVGEEGVIRDAMRLVHVRSAQAAIAIERFRRDHDGEVPRTLQELVPAYLPAVPDDPFTGNQLRFVVADDRFAVYSPGPDDKDNGGQVGPLPVHIWKVTTPDVGLEIKKQD